MYFGCNMNISDLLYLLSFILLVALNVSLSLRKLSEWFCHSPLVNTINLVLIMHSCSLPLTAGLFVSCFSDQHLVLKQYWPT